MINRKPTVVGVQRIDLMEGSDVFGNSKSLIHKDGIQTLELVDVGVIFSHFTKGIKTLVPFSNLKTISFHPQYISKFEKPKDETPSREEMIQTLVAKKK